MSDEKGCREAFERLQKAALSVEDAFVHNHSGTPINQWLASKIEDLIRASKALEETQAASRPAPQVEDLVKAVSEYFAELDNPAPDYHMRKLRRDEMRAALAAYRKD